MPEQPHACDVHVLIDNDSTPRPGTKYCGICDAWICPECRVSPVRRVRAAITRLKDRARIERDAKSTLEMLGV
jgi:hypothetical protein